MNPVTVLWILGGWFVLSAAGALIAGRMISRNVPADFSDAVDALGPAERPIEQKARPHVAA